MNLPICVNRLYWVSSKIVAYIYLLAGLFNSVQCTKNVLKRQKRDTVKSSVFSMDGDRSILHLHGNTVCRHLLVISCIGQMIVVRNFCGLVQYVNEWSYCLAGFCSVLLHA